ncbi:MAG: hypothetical protein GF308_11515 [Candidatus Heimdallarchaeota archaeon]|nr:hypothetical protein [Candidatus Heimdallarchaeota archaeon]
MSEENSYKICRVCGYIVDGEHDDNCPACGSPQRSFVPYERKIDAKRLKIIEFHLHPISTHFTIYSTMILTIIYIISLFTDSVLGINIRYGGVFDFLVYLLPFFVLITAILGFVDGKLRYKTIKTPFLRLKVIMGISLLLSSSLTLVFHLLSNDGTPVVYLVIEGILIGLSLILSFGLGAIGSKLICQLVPKGTIKES